MKNYKQYKQRLENHEDPRYTFVHWEHNRFYPCYSMTTDDLKQLRNEYNQDAKNNIVEKLDTRAIIIKDTRIIFLKSYYTTVAAIYDNKLYKLWNGYSKTTAKHIKMFCDKYNIQSPSKHDWIMQDITDIIDNATGVVLYEA